MSSYAWLVVYLVVFPVCMAAGFVLGRWYEAGRELERVIQADRARRGES